MAQTKDEQFLEIVQEYKILKRKNPKDPKLKELLDKRKELIRSGQISTDVIMAGSLL